MNVPHFYKFPPPPLFSGIHFAVVYLYICIYIYIGHSHYPLPLKVRAEAKEEVVQSSAVHIESVALLVVTWMAIVPLSVSVTY